MDLMMSQSTGSGTSDTNAAFTDAILQGIKKAKVLVLYVGGTLGMKVNAKGSLDVEKGYLTAMMREMHELKAPGMPEFDIIENPNLKDSSDMGVKDWLAIAQDIERDYYSYDGFMVCHGTDTMHYTAAALSFLLDHLAKPVIVTGAMVPFAEAYNDARRNIIVSMMFAASTRICEVCIFANDVLLRGNRAVKTHPTMSAFQSPNFAPLATMGADSFQLRDELLLPQPYGSFSTCTHLLHSNVIYLVVTPDLCASEFESFIAKHAPGPQRKPATNTTQSGPAVASSSPPISEVEIVDCIVFEVSGVSVAGSYSYELLSKVINIADRAGIVVVVSNYDLHGPLRAESASRIRKLCPRAVLIHDMTSETAVVKAMYLFGRGLPPARVRELLPVPLKGELTPKAVSHL